MSKYPVTKEPILHGLLIGGAIGMIAGWFGMDTGRALFLGLLAGFFAGLTKMKMDKKRKSSDE